jgi:hypothetical protein
VTSVSGGYLCFTGNMSVWLFLPCDLISLSGYGGISLEAYGVIYMSSFMVWMGNWAFRRTLYQANPGVYNF